MDWQKVLDDLRTAWTRLRPWVRDVSLVLDETRKAGQAILFEGAQGTLLDIDHGTYPYVTSSNGTIGGALHRPRHRAEGHRRRARRGQGLH